MFKKDIDHFRRQLKDHNDLLTIDHISNMYILKETDEIYHQVSLPFDLLEEEEKKLYFTNFKKIVTGRLDEKLFRLKFADDAENNSRDILYNSLLNITDEEWNDYMIEIVLKMLEQRQFEKDTVVTFVRGTYLKPQKKQKGEMLADFGESPTSHKFVLCTINPTEIAKSEIMFDYVEKEFRYNVAVDPVIKLKSPLTGFLYPTFVDYAVDVNHLLYHTNKAYHLDELFIENVLNAKMTMTGEDDKTVFEEVVKQVTKEEIDTSTLSNIYEQINQIIEESEVEDMPSLNYQDVETVLKNSGVQDFDTEEVKDAFSTIIEDSNYELKANNIIPKYATKSIKISTRAADIKVSPQDLHFVKQVNWNNRRYLMIELEENTMIEGFEIASETLIRKVEEDDGE